MTLKLESIVTWVPFGYGMIGKRKSDDPTTEHDPIIMFTHKKAVGGKFHNGEPILTPKEEKQMLKDIETLIAALNKFNHNDDFVKVDNNYNQPSKASRRAVAPVDVVETDIHASALAVAQANPQRGGRRKAVETVAQAPVKVKGTWGGRRIKGMKVADLTAAPLPTPAPEVKRPRGWNLRKENREPVATMGQAPAVAPRRSLIDSIPLTNIKEARGKMRKTRVIEAAPAPVAETPVKRPRGWNLRKGGPDTKAKATVVETPVVTAAVPEAKPRRAVSRKTVANVVPPQPAKTDNVPAKGRGGRRKSVTA